jgi:uncharacterized OB-fold protein
MMEACYDELPHYKCNVCGYTWIPRSAKPKKCPDCFSREWDTETPPDTVFMEARKLRGLV